VCIAALRAGLAAALVLALGSISSVTRRAVAHSWYPARCCGGEDCKRVDSIEMLADGDMLFRAGSIAVVVPAEFMRLPSPDNDAHVCFYRVGTGYYRPRCVFVPGVI
jgi:hypothetical protein